MSDRDNDAERFDGEDDESHGHECTCGENEACDECPDETDEEERPISLDLTRGEAIALLHVSWSQKFEYASDRQTAGIAQMMASIGFEVGKEVYGEEMATWLEERQKEQEEMVEEMMEKMGGLNDLGNNPAASGSGPLGFQ